MCSTADGSSPLLLNCHILKNEIRNQQFSKSIETFHTENVSIPSCEKGHLICEFHPTVGIIDNLF